MPIPTWPRTPWRSGCARTSRSQRGWSEGWWTPGTPGAALIAAHPSGPATSEEPAGATRRFWCELGALASLVDRFELINGHRAYGSGAEAPAAGGRSRRLPLDRPSLWVENAPALRQGRAGDRRMSPIPCDAPSRAVQPGCRARPPRCLSRSERHPASRAWQDRSGPSGSSRRSCRSACLCGRSGPMGARNRRASKHRRPRKQRRNGHDLGRHLDVSGNQLGRRASRRLLHTRNHQPLTETTSTALARSARTGPGRSRTRARRFRPAGGETRSRFLRWIPRTL